MMDEVYALLPEEINRIPFRVRNRGIQRLSTFNRIRYGFEIVFLSFLFIIEKSLYRSFLLDWLRVTAIGLGVYFFAFMTLFISFLLGLTYWKSEAISIVLGVITSIFFVHTLGLALVNFFCLVIRLDSYRRIHNVTKKVMTNEDGLDVYWNFCPNVGRRCCCFTIKIIIVATVESIIIFVVDAFVYLIPFGSGMVYSAYMTLCTFRVVFVIRGNYFRIYKYWYDNKEYALGLMAAYFLLWYVPFSGFIFYPLVVVVGTKFYYQMEYLRTLNIFDDPTSLTLESSGLELELGKGQEDLDDEINEFSEGKVEIENVSSDRLLEKDNKGNDDEDIYFIDEEISNI